MSQAQALRARGDITGALQARGLESHARILSGLFGSLAQHSYQQGTLGNQRAQLMGVDANGKPTLAAQENDLKIHTNNIIKALEASGNKQAMEIAERFRLKSEGKPSHPLVIGQPFGTPVDEVTGAYGQPFGFPQQQK